MGGRKMSGYISKHDEIDKWLFDSFGILPGCCNSQENLRHTTARMVAEVLWPKKESPLTWEDMTVIDSIFLDTINEMDVDYSQNISRQKFYEEVLARFNKQRKK